MMTTRLETVLYYKCQSCDALSEDGSGKPLYECSSCGNTFNRANGEGRGSTCPECHKFASRVADDSCSACEQGELEEVSVYLCPFCDEAEEIFEKVDDVKQHLAEQHAAELAEEYLR